MSLRSFFHGLFAPRKISYEYSGSPISQNYLSGLMTNPFGAYSGGINNLLTQAGYSAQGIGVSPLMSISNQYWQSMLGGEGLNPYAEGSPYQQYQNASIENFQRNILPKLSTSMASHGMLRGSGSERMGQLATQNLANTLQRQAYGAYQSALQRQYGAAQIAPQQALAEQTARNSALLNALNSYLNTSNQQARVGLAASGSLNSAYKLPYYAPSPFASAVGALSNLVGPAIGIAALASGNPAGLGMMGLFGNKKGSTTPSTTAYNMPSSSLYGLPSYYGLGLDNFTPSINNITPETSGMNYSYGLTSPYGLPSPYDLGVPLSATYGYGFDMPPAISSLYSMGLGY